LRSLAQSYYGSGDAWPRIYAANPQLDSNPDQDISGQRVYIPGPPAQQQGGDGLEIAVAGVLITAVTPAAALAALSTLGGLPRLSLLSALTVVMQMPPDRTGVSGPASMTIARMNLMRRAQFVVTSAKRLAEDMKTARSRGLSIPDALLQGITRERRYFAQHMAAVWNRTQAAAAVDSAAMQYGNLLGWNTVLDSHTSAECRAANRHNFLATQMPLIGYPGMVHPHCRCYPGVPFPGAALLPSAVPARGARVLQPA
jgi:hypothetical protein